MIKRFITTIYTEFSNLSFPERLLILLFVVRPLYLLVPETSLPIYRTSHPEYTYQVAVYFILLSLIELNIVYLLYRKYMNTITELLLWIAGGHFIDQFTKAAISPSLSEVLWFITSIVYICFVWKKKEE